MQIHSRRFLNNFKTVLTASWGTSGGASLPTIAGGEMSKLLAATIDGEHIIATLISADGSAIEIIRLIRGASAFTSERGQDGTTAQSWDAGDTLAVRVTAQTLNKVIEDLSQQVLTTEYTTLFVPLSGTYIATVNLSAIAGALDAKRRCYIDVIASGATIDFTYTAGNIFAEFYFVVHFTASYTAPTIKLNGTTKTPTGTGPSTGVDYMIKATMMGSAGVRLEYLIKS